MKKNIILLFLLMICCGHKVFSSEKPTIQEYIRQLMQLIKTGNKYAATQLANQMYNDYPNDGNSFMAFAVINYPDNCHAVIEKSSIALTMNIDTENRAVAKFMRGVCYYRQDDEISTIAELNSITTDEYRLLTADEKYGYHFIKAKCLSTEDYEAIIYNATRALEYEITPDMYFVRGLAYMQLGEQQKAKIDFENQKKLCSKDSNKSSEGCIFILELN